MTGAEIAVHCLRINQWSQLLATHMYQKRRTTRNWKKIAVFCKVGRTLANSCHLPSRLQDFFRDISFHSHLSKDPKTWRWQPEVVQEQSSSVQDPWQIHQLCKVNVSSHSTSNTPSETKNRRWLFEVCVRFLPCQKSTGKSESISQSSMGKIKPSFHGKIIPEYSRQNGFSTPKTNHRQWRIHPLSRWISY